MTPGFAQPRSKLPWLPYESLDRVIINSHNFTPAGPSQIPIAGYYARLDTGAAATDQFTSDGSHDGTLANGATRANDDGLAYSLDGVNDYISLGTSASLSPENLTASCWIKASGSPSLYDGIFGRSTTTAWQNGWGMFWQSATEVRFFVGRYDIDYAAVTGITPGAWNHLCGTWDGSIVRLYLNGVLGAKTAAKTGPQTATTSQLDVGRLVSNSYNFNGLIDDILIFGDELAQADVSYLSAQRGAIYA